jgi:hypothetical protein
MDDRAYVLSKWEKVREQVQHSMHEMPNEWHGFVIAVIDPSRDGCETLLGTGKCVERWAQARETTEAHERKIAELEEEIMFQRLVRREPNIQCGEPLRRTIARLDLALAELRRGWKEPRAQKVNALPQGEWEREWWKEQDKL